MRFEFINLGSAGCQAAVAGSLAGNSFREANPLLSQKFVSASCRDQRTSSLRSPDNARSFQPELTTCA
jgi:hypothetical protein